jgi:hypothetical protein
MSTSSDGEIPTYTIHSSPLPYQNTLDSDGRPGLSKVFRSTPDSDPNPQILKLIGERHTTQVVRFDKNDADKFTTYEIGATGQGIEAMERINESARDIARILNAFTDPGYVEILYPRTPPDANA